MPAVTATPLINVQSTDPSVPSSLRNSAVLPQQPEIPPTEQDTDLPTSAQMPQSVGMAPTSTADPVLQSLPAATKAELDRIEKQFDLGPEYLRRIVDQFVADFRLGLSKYGEPMAMIPTYVTGVPDGTETGTFLALDLGGTNLRVCEVTLQGNHQFTLRQQKYKVSTELKTGEATALFDYMADSVDHFLTDRAIDAEASEEIHLGLTFSFPVEQSALDKGVLLTWTKGFSAKNAIGNDIVGLLQDAFNRKHLHVKCTALVNDTVGTLMSRAYLSGDCLLGAIFGTGTNGAYVENINAITKLSPEIRTSLGANVTKMIINGEWGAFDNARKVLPITQFDNKLDRESINPRFQMFEKAISGMYQGEICRNLLLHLVDNGYLFNSYGTAQLNSHYGLDTAIMSDIETPAPEGITVDVANLHPAVPQATSKTSNSVKPDPQPDAEWHSRVNEEEKAFHAANANSSCQSIQTRKILVEQMGFLPTQVTDQDTEIVLWACRTVATRAARLSACAVAAVLEQSKQVGNPSDVGVDGSMVQFYPGFEDRLRAALRDLIGQENEQKVVIGMAKDGSGVGAALGALMAKKQAEGRVAAASGTK